MSNPLSVCHTVAAILIIQSFAYLHLPIFNELITFDGTSTATLVRIYRLDLLLFCCSHVRHHHRFKYVSTRQQDLAKDKHCSGTKLSYVKATTPSNLSRVRSLCHSLLGQYPVISTGFPQGLCSAKDGSRVSSQPDHSRAALSIRSTPFALLLYQVRVREQSFTYPLFAYHFMFRSDAISYGLVPFATEDLHISCRQLQIDCYHRQSRSCLIHFGPIANFGTIVTGKVANLHTRSLPVAPMPCHPYQKSLRFKRQVC